MPDVESPALLASARRGDTSAFCELCRLYEARLFRQAMTLCGHAATAEDLAQETFIAAWQSIRRYNGRCRFFTWLCSILIHHHQNWLRKKQPLARSVESSVADLQNVLEKIIDGSSCPDQAAAMSERAALLRQCLDDLPEKHRAVVFLRFFMNESLDEIATALDCSVGTVKSRLFHGLEKLRKMKCLSGSLSENE